MWAEGEFKRSRWRQDLSKFFFRSDDMKWAQSIRALYGRLCVLEKDWRLVESDNPSKNAVLLQERRVLLCLAKTGQREGL
jgi:hypothetical protein